MLVNLALDFSELDVNTVDKLGRTALHLAAQGNYLEGAKKLLSEGASSSFPYLFFFLILLNFYKSYDENFQYFILVIFIKNLRFLVKNSLLTRI